MGKPEGDCGDKQVTLFVKCDRSTGVSSLKLCISFLDLKARKRNYEPSLLQHFSLVIPLHLLLGWVWRYWLRRLIPREANHPDTGARPKVIELFLQLMLFVMRSLLWIGIVIYITDLFPFTREWSRRIASILWMSLISPVITLAEALIRSLLLLVYFFEY